MRSTLGANFARQAAIVLVVALVGASVVLIGGLGGETLARVNREVEVDWRPAYDLLVLPPDADVSLDIGGKRVTEANFMGALDGGISLDQWRAVKALRGVDVAAPVATVGYFRRDLPVYKFADLRPGFYQVDRKVSWDNGVDVRVQKRAYVPTPMARDEAVLRRCGNTEHQTLQLHANSALSGAAEYRALRRDIAVTGFYADALRYHLEEDASWDCLGLDPGGAFAVYGIDPDEEAALTGIDELVRGTYLDNVFGLDTSSVAQSSCSGVGKKAACERAYQIPLLVNTQGWTRTVFDIRFLRYDLPVMPPGALARRAGPCPPRLVQTLGVGKFCFPPNLRALFARGADDVAIDARLPINDSKFGGTMTLDDGEWERTAGFQPSLAGADYSARATPVRYEVLDDFPEGPWIGAVRAVPSGSYGPEPTFRRQVPPRRDPLLSYSILGTFDGSDIAERFSGRGRWLPEDTYRPPRAVLRYDAEGNRVEPAELRPTANPLGYLLEPPRALTTLSAARALLGPRPISAIRVRVHGVEEPGESAWTRIENVARSISEATGLDPVVTVGSSPARVLVEVPGITAAEQPSGEQAWRLPNFRTYIRLGGPHTAPAAPARTVEGFGWVEEPWLTEGAAISYLRAGAAHHLWLVVVLVAAAFVYLVAAFFSLSLAGIHDVAVRRAVGWPRRMVFLRDVRRAAILGFTGGAAGIVAGLAGAAAFGLPVDARLAILALPVAVLVCCGAALLPAWRAGSLPLAHLLSGGEVALGKTTSRRVGTPAQRVFQVALVELLRMRARVLLAIAAGVVATGSLLLLFAVRSEFGGSLQVTLLGQAILLETGPLQVAATVVASLLAVALLGEILWQSVVDRRGEIGVLRAIGWARGQVARLMVWQGVILGGVCGLFGVAAAGALLAFVFGLRETMSLIGPAAALAAFAGGALGLVASGVPAYRASRESPAGALRSL
ncbi:MAG TPA: ABC transporter permease [Actinomycetota bacterium]|nr:ABC transporter permease [Actinomycetota bacterium]